MEVFHFIEDKNESKKRNIELSHFYKDLGFINIKKHLYKKLQ